MCKVTHITLSHYTLCESTQFFPFGGKPIYTLCLSCHSIMSAVTQHYIVLSTLCQLPILLAEINDDEGFYHSEQNMLHNGEQLFALQSHIESKVCE